MLRSRSARARANQHDFVPPRLCTSSTGNAAGAIFLAIGASASTARSTLAPARPNGAIAARAAITATSLTCATAARPIVWVSGRVAAPSRDIMFVLPWSAPRVGTARRCLLSLAVAGAGVIDASSHRCFGLPGVAHYLLAGVASAPPGNSRQGERSERGLAVYPWTSSQNEPAARIHER